MAGTLFLYAMYRCTLEMPVERVDLINTLQFHKDEGKGAMHPRSARINNVACMNAQYLPEVRP